MSSIGLDRLRKGFLIGFLEAEACFFIAPCNGGQSMSCGASLVARDDDAPLIVALRAETGLGHLSPRRAYRTSKPQISWSITTRRDTGTLAGWLRECPPIGRKASICDVWSEAVETWSSRGAGRIEEMRRLRAELSRRARYSLPARPVRSLDLSDDFDRGYVTGFVVGDGHFAVHPEGARMTVHLRDDDRPLLAALQEAVGGSIYGHGAYGTSRPAASWVVLAPGDLARVRDVLAIDLFASRKQREFEIWRRAVDEHVRAAEHRRRRDRDLLTSLAVQIKEARRYVAPAATIEPERRREINRVDVRDRSLRALSEFATRTDGSLSATLYERLRHEGSPGWPQRNTIARQFGSWHAALEAAGLADREASSRERHLNRSRDTYDARRVEQRERVLASVAGSWRKPATFRARWSTSAGD